MVTGNEPPDDYDAYGSDEDGVPFAYYDAVDDMDLRDDTFAQDLLYAGWYDSENTMEDRYAAREDFFEYTGFDEDYDFPWDDWRDWYSQTSG